METIDIIPDIHGQAAKLGACLDALGWRRGPLGWGHSDPGRGIVFLGDFIDRGPENAAVIRIVRSLIDGGKARAIMGNHELNAIHFHTLHPETGEPLRPHSAKNLRQHKSFLDEFPPGARETRDVLDWMGSLPLCLEGPDFRAAHACWNGRTIGRLRAISPSGVLSEEQLIRASDPAEELHGLVEEITKGPEYRLPGGISIRDKDGIRRDHVRVQWWNRGARTWREIAISVPVPEDVPDLPLPDGLMAESSTVHDRPVFFGHYWLSGKPVLQGPNALCLDYSAGKDGPLVSYELRSGDLSLDVNRIRVHAPRS